MLISGMSYKIPEIPENSFRITLDLEQSYPRLDIILFEALQSQNENDDLKSISKIQFKKLFTEKRVQIKGQNAKAKSPVNSGTTYIDILL